MKFIRVVVCIFGLSGFACKSSSGGKLDEGDSETAGASTDDSESSADGGDASCISASDVSEEALFDQMQQGFEVRLQPSSGTLDGGALNGPPASFHQEKERIGDCRLLTYDGTPCDEVCLDGKVCFNGQCVQPPLMKSFGPLMLQDSKGFEEEVSPSDIDTYYFYETEFNSVDNNWVSMDLSEISISLTTCVPKPVEEASPFTELFESRLAGEDVVLKWTKTEQGARIYLRMTTCIGSHGGISPVEIECEGRDKGELTIPGAFIDALNCPDCWNLGICGSHALVRYHTDETVADGFTFRMNNIQSTPFFYFPGFWASKK